MMTHLPRKRFAQHWLRSEIALNKIIEAGQLKASDRVLEIGPGTGILTRRLLPKVNSVLAVEIDRDLCKKLVKSLGNIDNFLLLQGDILTLDLESQLENFPKFQNPNKVVANIPYNITGLILEKLLGTISNPNHYDNIVLLIQKEVAERLVAQPKTKAFGALSVKIQYLAHCEWICEVSRRDFKPSPKVDSAVIRLVPRTLAHPATSPKWLETLVKLGFSQRRKMLHNNLKSLINSDRLNPILQQLELNPQCRAEEISLEKWIELSNILKIEPVNE
jgi:16S rRNA (adenine1518-N6/adenine1519-N6)-dimethyltransferase